MTPVRVNLLLLGLVSLLGLALWVWPDPDHQGPLTSLDPDRLAVIRLGDRRGLKLVLERGPDGWRLTYPQAGPADPRRVQALARLAAARVYRSFSAKDGDLGAWGLDDPAYWVQLDSVALMVGADEPLRRRRYVRLGDQVHLIDDQYQQWLVAPVDAFLAQPFP